MMWSFFVNQRHELAYHETGLRGWPWLMRHLRLICYRLSLNELVLEGGELVGEGRIMRAPFWRALVYYLLLPKGLAQFGGEEYEGEKTDWSCMHYKLT